MGIDKSFSFPDNQITGQIAKEVIWSDHPLGHPSSWPLSLKLTLNTLFTSNHAVGLFWGDQNYFFYNDAFIPILGNEKSLVSMARPGLEVWGEVWNLVWPQIEHVRKSRLPTWKVDQYVPILREGKSSEAFVTYIYSPVMDEVEKILGILVISIERTDQINSEKKIIETQKKLFDAHEQFKLMSDLLPQLVWTCFPDGHCNYVNRQWVEFTGKSESSQMGFNWTEVIHPDDRALTETKWKNSVNDMNPYDNEYRIRRHDGVYRWFKARGSPYKNDEGKIILWIGTCTDIDDAKLQQLNYEKNVDLSPAMLWITDPSGHCSYLSNQWYRMTGQTIDEGLGFGWLDVTHPDDKDMATSAFFDANEKQICFSFEYRLKSKDGTFRWVVDAGNPRFSSQGEYLGMAGTVFDVHEKKLAEEALIKSRGDLYRLLMQAPSGVAFLKGPELIFNLANSNYQKIFGQGEPMVGKSLREVFPDITEKGYHVFKQVYNTGEPCSRKEYKSSLAVNGKDIYYNFSIQRINNSMGEPEGVIVIADDVTEQVTGRIAREEITKRLEAIVENMSEGLFLSDHNGKMIIWNPAAQKMHGIDIEKSSEKIEETLGLFQLYNLEGDVLDTEHWPINQVLKGNSITGMEVIVELLANNHRWIGSFSGSPIFNDQGDLKFAVITVRDVTLRINFEKDLKKAINSRDEFLSIISHELKTPLTSLKLQNQSALRKIKKGKFSDLTAEKLSIVFEKNESQINRVSRLVDDMLDLTRIQSGKFSYNFEKCDLGEIVNDVYDRFKEQFDNSNTLLVNQCFGEFVGNFDRDRIEQLIVNLLTNALKYGEGKEVVIRLKMIKKVACLEVIDHGMGIKPENFELIFKKYERIVSANEVSGLGIGLFISKEIVEAHGGKIWLESEVGKGATFIAELPLDSDSLNY